MKPNWNLNINNKGKVRLRTVLKGKVANSNGCVNCQSGTHAVISDFVAPATVVFTVPGVPDWQKAFRGVNRLFANLNGDI